MDTIASWEEVNDGLRRMGELDGILETVSSQQELELNIVRERYREELEGLTTERADIEQRIRAFCEAHKGDLRGKKHRWLTYGKVGYRSVASLTIPDPDITIDAIKSAGWTEAIRVVESIDKQALACRSDVDLARVGVKRTINDIWRIEPKTE